MPAPGQNTGASTGFNPLDAGTNLLGGLLTGVGGFLGGTGGQLLGAGLGIDALNDIGRRGKDFQSQALALGERAQTGTAFKPFSISTGFGGVAAGPQGGYTTSLSPQQQALQRQLSGITTGLTNTYGAGPDVSGFGANAFGQAGMQLANAGAQDPRVAAQRQLLGSEFANRYTGRTDTSGITNLADTALQSAPGLFQSATGSTADRQSSIYDQIRATQTPEEQRNQVALNNRLAAQGRTGLRTAQYGGSPEQFAMEQARAEAMNQASLSALQQAGNEQQRDFTNAQALAQLGITGTQGAQSLGINDLNSLIALQSSDLGAAQGQQGLNRENLAQATGLFGLGSQAAGLPAAFQQAQLGNLQTSMDLQYAPENQLLASLTPSLSLADLSSVAQRQGAGLLAEAGATGLEANFGAQKTKAEGLAGLYSSLLGAQGQAASSATNSAGGLFETAGNWLTDLF
jgi:hypothetical protein